MSCFKYKLLPALALLCCFSFAANANVEKFSPKECLMAEYETKVQHKGDFWGLMSSELAVNKDVCQIVVLDKGVLGSEWKVDICREPIHIKWVAKGSLSVHKRTGKCDTTNAKASEFCEAWSQLKAILEDKGLIFAEGEREKLSTSHGKIYCSYLLLTKHLDEGILFSKYQEPVDIYQTGLNPKKENISEEASAKETEDGEKVEAQGRF